MVLCSSWDTGTQAYIGSFEQLNIDSLLSHRHWSNRCWHAPMPVSGTTRHPPTPATPAELLNHTSLWVLDQSHDVVLAAQQEEEKLNLAGFQFGGNQKLKLCFM